MKTEFLMASAQTGSAESATEVWRRYRDIVWESRLFLCLLAFIFAATPTEVRGFVSAG
jgi:hypothetical protein